jgi:mRNA interferase MazF
MMQIKRGEIWLADLSPTIGREQAGTRPVLIVSTNDFNKSYANLVYAVPITSRNKNIRSHVEVLPPEGGLTLPSYIMCEAMRSISKQRLLKKSGVIASDTMSEVEDNIKILLEL